VEAADAAASELGDQQKVAWLHMIRGAIAYFESRDYDRAQSEYKSALAFFRATDAKRDVAIALHDMGLQAFDAGQYDDARRLIEESLEIARQLSDRDVESNAAGSLGTLELEQGNLQRAQALLIESLRLELGANAPDFAISNTLVTIAMLAATAGKSQTACLLIGARDAYLERAGAVAEPLIENIRRRALSQAAQDSRTELAANGAPKAKRCPLPPRSTRHSTSTTSFQAARNWSPTAGPVEVSPLAGAAP
jgi:tetratricopeptide (TPR) repeat protein